MNDMMRHEWRTGCLSMIALLISLALAACGGGPTPPRPSEATARSEQDARQSGGLLNLSVDASADTAAGARVLTLARGAPTQPRVDVITLDELVDRILLSVGQNSQGFDTALARAGLSNVVESITHVDGTKVSDFSAETVLKEVYWRAEAHEAGQGERVLAYLYQEQAKQFPAVAEDPDFARLRAVVEQSDPTSLNPARFSFAEDKVEIRALPTEIEASIRALSYVFEKGNTTELIRVGNRAFRNPGYLERHLANQTNTQDAIRAAFIAHIPPPRLQEVARDLLKDAIRFPAVTESPEFLRRLVEIDPQLLDFDASTERMLRQLSTASPDLASRQHQLREAAKTRLPGEQTRRNPDSLEYDDSPRTANESTDASRTRKASAQHYANYVVLSLDERPNEPMSSGGGGGGGGGAPLGNREYKTQPPPPDYRQRVREANLPRVPRTYSTAIRSARAARGIAVGGELTIDSGFSLRNAAWVANPRDNRFGRFVLEVERKADGKRHLVRSRTLFADSAMAAVDVLRGNHRGAGEYREGEVLILMSMDPFDIVDPAATRALGARARELRDRFRDSIVDQSDTASLLLEVMQLQISAAKLPRRIVIHPALHGRELAWAAARVDFWFNDLEGLSEEASEFNDGKPIPAELLGIDVGQASTWQFYERDSSLSIEFRQGDLGEVKAGRSGAGESNDTISHFAVSMFVFNEDDETGEGRQLPELEKELQPLLDWLATNHPDFIRVNDYSEAFSILRWLQREQLPLTVLDLMGPPPPIATPDRIVVGEGPKVQ